MQQGTAQTQHRLQYLGAERPYAAFQRDQVKKVCQRLILNPPPQKTKQNSWTMPPWHVAVYTTTSSSPLLKKEEEDSVLDDDNPWSLPINHQITQSLDTTGLIQASLDTAIPETNVGYKLLQKMGWKSGTGLGKNGTGMFSPTSCSETCAKVPHVVKYGTQYLALHIYIGRVEPIRAELKEDFLGVGKKEEEEHFAEVATAKRKALDVEKEESELVKKQKAVISSTLSFPVLWSTRVQRYFNQSLQEQAAKQERIEQTVAEQNRPFYCSLCNKQYTNVTQYDTHLSSYDHHHKKVHLFPRNNERLMHLLTSFITALDRNETSTTKPQERRENKENQEGRQKRVRKIEENTGRGRAKRISCHYFEVRMKKRSVW